MIYLQGIKKSFNQLPVLKGINLKIEKGRSLPSLVQVDRAKRHC